MMRSLASRPLPPRGNFFILVFGFLAMLAVASPAWALTTAEQAHINVLRAKNPVLAENAVKALEKLKGIKKRTDLTNDQKTSETDNVWNKLVKNAQTALKAAQVVGDLQQRADAELALGVVLSLETDDPSTPAPDANAPAEVRAEYNLLLEEKKKAEEEKAKREAELKKGNGIAPEHSSVFGGDSGWSLGLGGGIGWRQTPKQAYLVKEIGGILTFGAVMAERDVTESSWDVAIRYAGEFSGFANRRDDCDCDDCDDCDDRYGSGRIKILEIYASGSHGSDRQNHGDLDPGAGVGLGIPGVGDGTFPAGVFLLDLPGFSNDVSDMRARYEFDSYQLGLRFGREFDWSPKSSIMPFLGTSYAYTSERQSFGGEIDGYGLNFDYDTRIKFDTFKVDLGARFEHSLSGSFSVYAEPSASLNFICVKGWDGLELSGLVTDSQRVDLDETETLPGFRLVVGFDWEPEDTPVPFSLYVGARVAHEPNSATVHRSGETGDQSEVDVEYSTSYSVNASISFKF